MNGAERYASVPRPPGRHLYGEELEIYVRELAARPRLWSQLIRHEAGRRNYSELFSDDYLTAWLICWVPDNDTGFHDHDISWGAVSVVSGQVREERLPPVGAPLDATYGAGQSFCFSPVDIHRVRHAGAVPAVTLHVYSPPLLSMGAYERGADGELRRVLLPASEELRAEPASHLPREPPRRRPRSRREIAAARLRRATDPSLHEGY